VGLLEPIQNLLGGGTGALWMIGGGIVLGWLALKAAKMAMRIVLFSVGGAMLLGSAPWAGAAAVEGPVADCSVAAVIAAMQPWQQTVAKRVTVERITADAACLGDDALGAGAAEVKLRTMFDIPFQTWDVTAEGAAPRDLDLPAFDTSKLLPRSDEPSE